MEHHLQQKLMYQSIRNFNISPRQPPGIWQQPFPGTREFDFRKCLGDREFEPKGGEGQAFEQTTKF